jgi:CelD/BcsL family acetyltransferase involved in cellulose biosynthesis
VGIAPLVRRIVTRPGIRLHKLEFATHHSDYNELVVGKDVRALTHAVMDYLASSARDWDLIDLKELRDDGSLIADIESAAVSNRLQCRFFSEMDGCPYIPIEAPWSETWKKLSLGFAQRAFRGIQSRAREGFRVRVVEDPELENGLLERIIAVEAQKRIGGELLPPILGKYPEVFQSLLGSLGPLGYIAIVLVEKDTDLVAYMILYRCGKKLWNYQTAYNRAYSVLSPGTILICAAIDYGFKLGYDEFDFLRGMDPYKLRWTASFHQNRRMILWNSRSVSRLYAVLYLRHRVPASQESYSPV